MKILRTLAIGTFASILAASLIPASPARADLSPCFTAAKANEAAKSYRAVMTTSHGTSTIDVVNPDRFHMTGFGMETVAIGSKIWIKTGSHWRSMPGFPIGTMVSAIKDYATKNQKDGSCVDAGMGTWHGVPAHIFKGSSNANGGTSAVTMYVFPDGYVHHIEVHGLRGVSSMDFSDFNAASVNPPV